MHPHPSSKRIFHPDYEQTSPLKQPNPPNPANLLRIQSCAGHLPDKMCTCSHYSLCKISHDSTMGEVGNPLTDRVGVEMGDEQSITFLRGLVFTLAVALLQPEVRAVLRTHCFVTRQRGYLLAACDNQSLQEIPPDLPRSISALSFSFNQLARLTDQLATDDCALDDTFPLTEHNNSGRCSRFPSIEYLDFSYNDIETISSGFLSGVNRLRTVDFSNNKLRLTCPPPTKANWVQSPAESLLDFRIKESCRTMPLVGRFSQGSAISPTLSFRCCSIITLITLIDSQELAVKSRPNIELIYYLIQ
ncbi:hypothetical protein PR048_019385 [Dryococelus australis]|uniref:Uncharacterized protein n=1 Tax=Dryococelus australis TaxID=614101 RepID=A0ABQ9H3F8_9NEOP|nr:hypothetical protein PR048_019385 [Dryococelus australis]